jgi:hypothetical protein
LGLGRFIGGTLCSGTFCSWDVFGLGRFVLGRFVRAPSSSVEAPETPPTCGTAVPTSGAETVTYCQGSQCQMYSTYNCLGNIKGIVSRYRGRIHWIPSDRSEEFRVT